MNTNFYNFHVIRLRFLKCSMCIEYSNLSCSRLNELDEKYIIFVLKHGYTMDNGDDNFLVEVGRFGTLKV